jgi:HPt (histidine-containing phosphotransfer) domain-containing protein
VVVDKLLKMMPKQALYELFAACIADSRTSIDAIEVLIRQGNLAGVAPLAHRVKGAASMVGAAHLAWLAAGLEAGGYKPAATPAVLDDLRSACSELERMLLAGNLTGTQGPHDHLDHSRNT